MKTCTLVLFVIFYHIYRYTSIKIKPELKKNILKFGYGINYKYEGILVHSFNQIHTVTKFILPSIGDVKFSKLDYDTTCAYLEEKKSHDAVTVGNSPLPQVHWGVTSHLTGPG